MLMACERHMGRQHVEACYDQLVYVLIVIAEIISPPMTTRA